MAQPSVYTATHSISIAKTPWNILDYSNELKAALLIDELRPAQSLCQLVTTSNKQKQTRRNTTYGERERLQFNIIPTFNLYTKRNVKKRQVKNCRVNNFSLLQDFFLTQGLIRFEPYCYRTFVCKHYMFNMIYFSSARGNVNFISISSVTRGLACRPAGFHGIWIIFIHKARY